MRTARGALLVSLAHLALAVSAATDTSRTLEVRDWGVADDGVSTFDVVVPNDGSLVELGRAEVSKIDVVSPDFASYAQVNGEFVKRTVSVPETSCAYAGYSPSSIVSLVSCGAGGATIAFTLPDGTTYRARKSDGALETVEGSYLVDVFARPADNAENETATSAVDRLTMDTETSPRLDVSFVEFVRAAAASGPVVDEDQTSLSRRRRLLQGTTQRVTFDYAFVSDHKRYLNYGGEEERILADTIAEIAAANAIFLAGDRFTPQIQFRMATHIVWTDGLPSVVNQTNVESDPYDENGHPARYIDIQAYLLDFEKYAFHTSEWNLETKQVVTGDMKIIGDVAHGWFLLTGFYGSASTVGLANTNTVCYTFSDTYRTGCQTLLVTDEVSYDAFHTGVSLASDDTGPCVPNKNFGLASTLNTPGHYFPGLVLAHELGHNLGFEHVYVNGDNLGNVAGCNEGEFQNDGTAVMGHAGQSANVSWSQCSVNKFESQWISDVDHFGNPTSAEGGLYACASNNFETTKLTATTNPFSAFGVEEMFHHVSNPLSLPPGSPANPSPPPGSPANPSPPPGSPENPSPPPGSPANPSPPPAPLHEGHVPVVYKLTFGDALSEYQKSVLEQAILQNNGVHGVAT